MAKLKIRCVRCRSRWELHEGEDWHEESTRTCPSCGAQIDAQIWEKEIMPAFGAMGDANRELIKHHLGFKAPLFRVDFASDAYK